MLKSKYITADDFKEYFGIDLANMLKSDDNPSDTANAFLTRLENRIEAYIDANFYRKVEEEYQTFSDYQKKHYKLALLEQAMYIIRNGDISTDSGYDPEEGVKATPSQLKAIIISPNCKEQLILCGLWCRKIRNRGVGGLDGYWML